MCHVVTLIFPIPEVVDLRLPYVLSVRTHAMCNINVLQRRYTLPLCGILGIFPLPN